MPRHTARFLTLAALAAAGPLAAQAPTPGPPDTGAARPASARPQLTALAGIGTEADERARLLQDRGLAPTDGYLLRSGDRLMAQPAGARGVAVILPQVRGGWSSDIPFLPGGGGLWMGAGASVQATAGFRLWAPHVALTVAPQVQWMQNSAFQTIAYLNPRFPRSPYASPWHAPPQSIDLPLRFGGSSFARVLPGQSSLAVSAGSVRFGISTANEWWGPGMQSALVLSDNATGIPRLFVRTGRPLRTPAGDVEAVWFVGRLTESGYFEQPKKNPSRSLAAAALTFRPAVERDLTVGVARAVYSPLSTARFFPARFLDAVLPARRDTADGARPREQVFSLFGRWIFPASGVEAYGEWAGLRLPVNARMLLEQPNPQRGYTLGLAWADSLGRGRVLRLAGELSDLEQSAGQSFYTSEVVPAGYTQRGQVIGAALGPGGSSQWLGADLFAARWRLGVTLARYRWDNDALYTSPHPSLLRHDVSVVGGLRAGRRLGPWDLDAQLLKEKRFDFLFQNASHDLPDPRGVDVGNFVVRLSLTAAVP